MARTFRIVETLGVGAFGAVHLAEIDAGEGLVQRLAVKWLHPQWSHDGELLGRLRDEARLLALLNHDHVVHVHGLTRMGGRLAILMEAIEGVDLSRVEGHAVPAKAAMELIERISDALDAAWNTANPATGTPLRVVHRDIKPSNIMITARGGVKVMDFGVARATFDSREAQTQGQQYGTARYMAPERWLHGTADAPSDIFSLGITAIEVMSGTPVERPRLDPSAFVEDVDLACARMPVSAGIQELVRQMTAFDPKDRPTAAEVTERARLLAAAEGEPGLRVWAHNTVPMLRSSRTADPQDGAIVVEDVSAETFDTAVALAAPTAATPIPTRTDSNRFGAPSADHRPRRRNWWEYAGSVTAVVGSALLMAGIYIWLINPLPGRGTAAAANRAPKVSTIAPASPMPGWEANARPLEILPGPELAPTVALSARGTKTPAKGDTRARPKPPEEPPVDPPKVVEVPSETLTFSIPPGFVVIGDDGTPFISRRGYNFPRGEVVKLTVTHGQRTYSCNVYPSRHTVTFTADDCIQ